MSKHVLIRSKFFANLVQVLFGASFFLPSLTVLAQEEAAPVSSEKTAQTAVQKETEATKEEKEKEKEPPTQDTNKAPSNDEAATKSSSIIEKEAQAEIESTTDAKAKDAPTVSTADTPQEQEGTVDSYEDKNQEQRITDKDDNDKSATQKTTSQEEPLREEEPLLEKEHAASNEPSVEERRLVAYVFTGVAVASFATGATFAYLAVQQYQCLANVVECNKTLETPVIGEALFTGRSEVEFKALVADMAFLFGTASTLAAVNGYLRGFIFMGDDSEKADSSHKEAPETKKQAFKAPKAAPLAQLIQTSLVTE